MFASSHAPLPKSLSDKANYAAYSHAGFTKAVEAHVMKEVAQAQVAQAEAELKKLQTHQTSVPQASSDTIKIIEKLQQHIVQRKSEIETHGSNAEAYYAYALDHEQKHLDEKSTLQRWQPVILNSLIGTAVAAEIISIPVLIGTMIMMTKHCGKKGHMHEGLPF